MNSAGLELRDVTVCYGRSPAVHHVSAVIPRGVFAALVGPNGAGKSTLLRAIPGLLPLTTGSITYGGEPASDCRGRMQYLPQRAGIDWDFPIDVRTLVATGLHRRLGLLRGFGVAERDAVAGALAAMGLERLAARPLGALSGGQQQRALVARALAGGAEVLLLDEPFAGLDLRAADDLALRLRDAASSGRTVVAVVHDLALARARCDLVLLLRTHLVAAGSPAQALAEHAVAEAFGAARHAETP